MDHKLLTKARALATELRCLLDELETSEHSAIFLDYQGDVSMWGSVGCLEGYLDSLPLKGCTQITYQYHEGEEDAN
jgi:hypothetical protein